SRGLRKGGIRIDGEWSVCVEFVIGEVSEGAAMDIVLATASHDIDHAALTAAKLCRRGGGDHAKFLDSVVYLERNCLVATRGYIVHSVEQEIIAARTRARHAEGRASERSSALNVMRVGSEQSQSK